MTRVRLRPPLPHPTRDWVTITLRFIAGAIFGAPFGLVAAMKSSPSDAMQVGGLIAGALIGGVLSAWLGRQFWERVPLMHWRGWFMVAIAVRLNWTQ